LARREKSKALGKLASAMASRMRESPKLTPHASRLLLIAAAVATTAMSTTPATAQYIGGNAPALPSAPTPGTIESPAATLSRSIRILAANPRDFAALIAAGRAELELGELEAAVGFFGRADEVRPNDPAPKVGMGAATIQTGDARGALRWFDQAQRLGASASLLGADRGLAHDLLGELPQAQADYRAALSGPNANEARRRLALSQAMSGKMEDALRTLSPLVVRSDPAALRTRAFVLALGGQQQLAARAIDQAMPGSASRIGPFFNLLPRLSVAQKAAAVHLGVFPNPGEMQLAAATQPTPVAVAAQRPVKEARVRKPKPQKLPVGRRTIVATTPIATPQVAATTPQPAFSVPVATPTPAPVTQAPPQQVATVVATPVTPAATIVAPAEPAATGETKFVSLDRLSGIDRLLAQTAPDPAKPRVETPRKPSAAERRAADKKAADKKLATEKAAAEKKAREDAARLGVAGTHWVQLAGGRNEGRMVTEYKRLQAKKGSPLKGRSGYVSQGKDYYRLLVGPFDDAADARAFVNKLAKADVDGFSWSRSPAQIKIEKLPSK
jgi:Flp pilus assembly protein TadD